MTFQQLSIAAACFVAMVFVSSQTAEAQRVRTRGIVRSVAVQPTAKGYKMQVALTSNAGEKSAWTKTQGDATLADKSEPAGSDDDTVVVYKLNAAPTTFHFAVPEDDYEITTDFVINPKNRTVTLVSSGGIGMSWDVASADDGIALSKKVVASPKQGTIGGSTTHEWKIVPMPRKQDDAGSVTFVFNWRGRELATAIVHIENAE
ncbi:MAG: hypothetical protein ACRC46_04500 [Thermoguttaceae bacterium]